MKAALSARNQAAHLFQDSTLFGEGREEAASFVKAVSVLRMPLGGTDNDYWGGMTELVQELLAEQLDHLRVIVQTKLQGARKRLMELGERASLDLKQTALANRNSQYSNESIPFECPVCQSIGIAYGEVVDEGEPDYDGDPHEPTVSWGYDYQLYLHSFECFVCQIELKGEDELQGAGLPEKEHHDEVNPGDFYEPDEDYYRDR